MFVTIVTCVSALCLLLAASRTLKSYNFINRLPTFLDTRPRRTRLLPVSITAYMFVVSHALAVVNVALVAPAHFVLDSAKPLVAVIAPAVKEFTLAACGSCVMFVAVVDTNACLQWDTAVRDLLRVGVSWSSIYGALHAVAGSTLRNVTDASELCMPVYGDDLRTKALSVAGFTINVIVVLAACVTVICSTNKVACETGAERTLQECVPPGRSVSAVIFNGAALNAPLERTEISAMHKCCVIKMALMFAAVIAVDLIVDISPYSDGGTPVETYHAIRECVAAALLYAFYEQYRQTAEAVLVRMKSCPISTAAERPQSDRSKPTATGNENAAAKKLRSRQGSLSIAQPADRDRSVPSRTPSNSSRPDDADDKANGMSRLRVPVDPQAPRPNAHLAGSFCCAPSQRDERLWRHNTTGNTPVASTGVSMLKLPLPFGKGKQTGLNIPNITVETAVCSGSKTGGSRDNLSSLHSLSERLSQCVSSVDLDNVSAATPRAPTDKDMQRILDRQQNPAAVLMDPIALNAKLTQYVRQQEARLNKMRRESDMVVEEVDELDDETVDVFPD